MADDYHIGLFSDEMPPDEAGRKDARDAMVEARKVLRSVAIAGRSPILGTRILKPFPKTKRKPDAGAY